MNHLNKKRRVALQTYLLPVDDSLLPDGFKDLAVEDGKLVFDVRWPRFQYRRLSIGEYAEILEMTEQNLSTKEMRDRENELTRRLIVSFHGDPTLHFGRVLNNTSIESILNNMDMETYQDLVKTVFGSGEVAEEEKTSFLGS